MDQRFLTFSKKRKSGIVPRVGHLRTVLKPFGGVTVVFVVPGSSLILLNPFQTNFSVYQESPQNGLRD